MRVIYPECVHCGAVLHAGEWDRCEECGEYSCLHHTDIRNGVCRSCRDFEEDVYE